MSFSQPFQGDFSNPNQQQQQQQQQFIANPYVSSSNERPVGSVAFGGQNPMISQMNPSDSAVLNNPNPNAQYQQQQQFQQQTGHLQPQQHFQPVMSNIATGSYGYNPNMQSQNFQKPNPAVLAANLGNNPGLQQQLKYGKGPLDMNRVAALNQAAAHQRQQQQQQQQQQQKKKQVQLADQQGRPPIPGVPAGVAPGPPGDSSVPELSSPEKVIKVIDEMRDEPKTVEERNLVEIIRKDAKQLLLYQNSEKQIAADVLKNSFRVDFYTQLQLLRQQNPAVVFKDGYKGYGNGWAGSKTTLQYPRNKKRIGRYSRDLWLTPQQVEQTASHPETLIPIRIDFDEDKFRLRDTFTWNLTEPVITVAQFAETLLDDFGIPIHLAPQIIASMNEQIADFQPHSFSRESNSSILDNDDDMRITIKLDITVGQHNLVDQFEWDINSQENSPEHFAESMARDLALSGEFATAIAHAIREQSELYTKSLIMTGHQFDGRIIEDDEIRRELRPTINLDDIERGFLRAKHSLREFSPVLFEIPDGELDRQDKDRDRDSRRKRRQGRAGRRGGPTLPDLREHIRTFRTPVYSSILPGGIDKNLEVLRKQLQKLEESDDEEEGNTSMSSSRRRGARISSNIAASNIYKQASSGRPPLKNQIAVPPENTQRPSQTRYAFQVPQKEYLQEPLQIAQTQVLSGSGSNSLVVKLKVPHLGQFLAMRGIAA